LIRPAKLEDAKRLAEIHVSGWRYAYKGIISDEVLFKRLNVNNRINSFKEVIRSEKEETYVFDDGNVKGFLTIGNCRDTDKDGSSFELWGLYVDHSFWRNHIGEELLFFAEEQALIRKRKEVVLWVLKDNSGGRKFYE